MWHAQYLVRLEDDVYCFVHYKLYLYVTRLNYVCRFTWKVEFGEFGG